MKKLASVFFIFITLFSVAFFVFPKQTLAGSCSVDYDWEFFTRTGTISKQERAVADTWKYFLNYDGGSIELAPSAIYSESYINSFDINHTSAWVNYKTCGFGGPAVIIGMHAVWIDVKGKVLNCQTNQPIANVEVYNHNDTFGSAYDHHSTTDINGNYILPNQIAPNSGYIYSVRVVGNQNSPQSAPSSYKPPAKTTNTVVPYGSASYENQKSTNGDCNSTGGCNFCYDPSGSVAATNTPIPSTTQTPQNSCSTICQNAGFQCGSLQGCTCANTCTNGLVCSYNLCTPTTGTAMCSKPNKPTIIAPIGTQMNGGAVEIIWGPPKNDVTNSLGGNFTHYALRIDDLDDGNGFPGFDALPPDIVVDNIPKTQTSYSYLGAVPGHHYHIWVHAVNHPYYDCNQWSDPFEIGNIVAIAGATNTPTPTPTPTTGAPQATATIPPNCQYKTKGDADCNNVINVFDFQAWRNEISGTSTEKTADFDRNGVVTVLDFQIWRDGMVNPPPTLTPTPGTLGCTPSTVPQEVTTSITDVTTTTDYKQMIIKFRGRATNDTTITDTDFTAKVYGQYQNHSFGNAYNYSGSNPYLLVTFEGSGTGQIGTYAAGFLNVTIDGVSKKIYFPSFTIPDEASTISFYVGADGSTYYANSTHLTNSWFNNGLRQWQGYANSVNLSPLQAMVTAHRAVDSCTQN